MRWLFVLIGVAGVAGCAQLGSAPLEPNHTLSPGETGTAKIVSDLGAWPADRLEFENLEVVGDTLIATVSYGGGCAEHTFALVFADVFLESYPVQMNGLLSHDAQGDPCRALISRTLRFDLSPLKDAYRAAYRRDSDPIMLRGNWQGMLRYEF